jgi:hypothetical protein
VNGKLYEVKIQGPVLHRGDMNITDEIFLVRADVVRAGVLAERYWRGEESTYAQIELLVMEAVVVSAISTSEKERRRAFAARLGIQLP